MTRTKYDPILGDLRERDDTINLGTSITDVYQLQLADANKLLTFSNTGSTNITIPKNVFSAGDFIYIEQIGVGVLTLVAEDINITVNGNKKSAGQYTTIGIYFRDATTNANICTVIGGVA